MRVEVKRKVVSILKLIFRHNNESKKGTKMYGNSSNRAFMMNLIKMNIESFNLAQFYLTTIVKLRQLKMEKV